MDGRASGVGFPILMGGYLLYKYLPQTKLFNENADRKHSDLEPHRDLAKRNEHCAAK